MIFYLLVNVLVDVVNLSWKRYSKTIKLCGLGNIVVIGILICLFLVNLNKIHHKGGDYFKAKRKC